MMFPQSKLILFWNLTFRPPLPSILDFFILILNLELDILNLQTPPSDSETIFFPEKVLEWSTYETPDINVKSILMGSLMVI